MSSKNSLAINYFFFSSSKMPGWFCNHPGSLISGSNEALQELPWWIVTRFIDNYDTGVDRAD